MNPFRLTDGDIVVIDTIRFLPSTPLENGIALRPEAGGNAKVYAWSELTQLWLDRRLRIEPVAGKGLSQTQIEDMRRDMSSFSEKQQEIAKRRLRYVRALEFGLSVRDHCRIQPLRPGETRKPSRIVLKAQPLTLVSRRIAKVIEPNGIADAPSGAALLQWYRRYQRSGRLLTALIPQHHRQGNGKPRLWPQAVETMQKFAVRHYLHPEQERATDIFCMVRDQIRILARKAGYDEAKVEASIPDIQAFYRVIRNIEAREKTYYRDSPQKADRKYRIKGRGRQYQRPGQAVQIDSTKLPIVVRDPLSKLRFKQITLTVVICLATRAILGFYVGLEEGYPTIQEALRMAMLPKTWLSKLEGIEKPMIATAKPSRAELDQGSDYRSLDLVMACAQLGIRVVHTPAGRPDYKGIIERQFRETKEGLFKGMPGSLFKNKPHRVEYDAAGNAKLEIGQVTWLLAKFFSDVYMHKWHDGIEDSPDNRWRKLSEVHHVDMAPSIDQLIPLISMHKVVTIQHTGIEWMSLFYGHGSHELQALLNRHGAGKVKYQFKIDTMDVGRGYLLTDEGKWIVLEASDPAARGRTRHDHLVIRAEARSRKKAHERVTQADMDRARRDLRAPMEAENEKRANMRIASREARFRVGKVDPLAHLKADHIEGLGLEAAYAEAEEDLLPIESEPDAPAARRDPPKPAVPRSRRNAKQPTEAPITIPVETPIMVADEPTFTAPETAAPCAVGVIEDADTEMPSVAIEVAADVMPTSRRIAAVVDFDFF